MGKQIVAMSTPSGAPASFQDNRPVLDAQTTTGGHGHDTGVKQLKDEIAAAIAETKGKDLITKLHRYSQVAAYWKRQHEYPKNAFLQFSNFAREVVHAVHGWDETPPVWYHGGPEGLSAGAELLSWPRAYSTNKSLIQNAMAGLGAVRREHWAYFTPDRGLALVYAGQSKNQWVYRVQPEGEIQLDPEVFLLVGVAQMDGEINSDLKGLAYRIIGTVQAFRARTVRVLGVG
jgi:hypothetical protein